MSVLPGNPTHYQDLETFLSSLLGIRRERLAPIQQYPNICESKRPFRRAEKENPHPSQKSEGLRHPQPNRGELRKVAML